MGKRGRKPRFTIGQAMLLIGALAIEMALLPRPIAVAAGLATCWVVWMGRLLRARIVVPVAVVMLLGPALLPDLSTIVWVGQRRVTIEGAVVNAVSGRPIAGATVRLVRCCDGGAPAIESEADRDGRVELTASFSAVGRQRGYTETGSVNFSSWWLIVSAEGYRTRWTSLVEHTGRSGDLHDAAPRPFSIGLVRVEPGPDRALADLAGTYFAFQGETGSSFRLGANGSYRWEDRAESIVVFDRSRGTARLAGGRLVLSPWSHSGPLPKVLLPVRWGPRTYLVREDELGEFRAEIERGEEPRGHPFGRFLLREGDWEREVGGRPDLPPDSEQDGVSTGPTGKEAGREDAEPVVDPDVGRDRFGGVARPVVGAGAPGAGAEGEDARGPGGGAGQAGEGGHQGPGGGEGGAS